VPGTGVMYLKAFESFNASVSHCQGQSESHTRPSEPCAS
jgi:hypothetical protein